MKTHKVNVKSILQKLLRINQFSDDEKPLELKKSLSSIRPNLLLPSALPRRQFRDQTLIYTYQPSRPYLSALKPLNEFLIKESPKEKLSKLDDNQRLLTFAKLHLPLRGVLKQRGGHYYLEVSPRFTRTFPHGKSPTYGQKIPIIHPQEGLSSPLPEEGMMFSFTLKGYYRTEPIGWPSVKTAYLLLIESPALEELRSKHHLSPTPYGHDFHLLLSVDPSFEERKENSYYHVNISNHQV